MEITKIFLFSKTSKYKGQRAKNCHIKKKIVLKLAKCNHRLHKYFI